MLGNGLKSSMTHLSAVLWWTSRDRMKVYVRRVLVSLRTNHSLTTGARWFECVDSLAMFSRCYASPD